MATSSVTWRAIQIMTSGATEPTWPTTAGATVVDGSITWTAYSTRIPDAKCPHSKNVAIAASKVYADDDDIIRYSATVDPLDWSSANDAGYLAYGLQTYGGNPVSALNLYRSNLVAFNTEGFQMWQVDEDPALSALLDALPIGSNFPTALTPVSNDLFMLTSQGVRTMGIAAGSTNLQAGDVGKQIDPLVLDAIAFYKATVGDGSTVLATYYPGAGQYWLAFGEASGGTLSSTVYVYTMSSIGKVGAWSRYVFNNAIEAFAQKDDDLYIRFKGGDIVKVDETVFDDYHDGATPVTFTGAVQYPWLDLGQPGVNKMLEGLDYVGEGQAPSVRFGYDQSNPASLTDAYAISADTVPGTIIPYGLVAPSMSLRLEFAGGAEWRVLGANLYLHDDRATT